MGRHEPDRRRRWAGRRGRRGRGSFARRRLHRGRLHRGRLCGSRGGASRGGGNRGGRRHRPRRRRWGGRSWRWCSHGTRRSLGRCGLRRYGLRTCGLGRRGLRRCGLRTCGLGRCGLRTCGLGRCGLRTCGLGRCGLRTCGLGRRGLRRRALRACGLGRCGLRRCALRACGPEPGRRWLVSNFRRPGRGPHLRVLGRPRLSDGLRVPGGHRIPRGRRLPGRLRARSLRITARGLRIAARGLGVSGRPGSGSRLRRCGPRRPPGCCCLPGRTSVRFRLARGRRGTGRHRATPRGHSPGPPRLCLPGRAGNTSDRLRLARGRGVPRRHRGGAHGHSPGPARFPGWFPDWGWGPGRGTPRRHVPGPPRLADGLWIPRIAGGRLVSPSLHHRARARGPGGRPCPPATPLYRGRGDGPPDPGGYLRHGLGRNGRGFGDFADPDSAPPDPPDDHDVVFFGQRRHPAPSPRFTEVARLRDEQFRQALALQYRPGCQPREQPRREHVEPEQVVVERQPENGEQDDVGNRDSGKNGDLTHWNGHWQAEIVELVQPFFNPPDARIGGQFHRSLSLCRGKDQWTPSALAMP